VNWQIGGVTYRDMSARLDFGVIKSVLIPMSLMEETYFEKILFFLSATKPLKTLSESEAVRD
jgi:hypothetical protein